MYDLKPSEKKNERNFFKKSLQRKAVKRIEKLKKIKKEGK